MMGIDMPIYNNAIIAMLFCTVLRPLVSDRYANFWRHFVTASCAQKVLVSGCSLCDIVNQTPKIRHIGVQLPFHPLSLQIAADIRCPVSI